MPGPNIFDVAEQFKRDLLRHVRQATSEMVHAYGVAWRRIKAQIDDLTLQIEAARQRGEELSAAWLFQHERLRVLQAQVEAELREFARFAEGHIIAGQAEAVEAAQAHAEQLILLGLGEPPPGVTLTLARLPREAVERLVGFLQDGSPLRDLLDRLGPEASRAVRDRLIAGLITGLNPREIARQIRGDFGGNLRRALVVARTEILRAYREATYRAFQANADVLDGWIWHASLSTRTCAACWAMHGTFHHLDERLDDHPNGRCAMVPVTKTWKELGFADISETRAQVATGESLFARLPEEQQRMILGNAAFEAYKAGVLKLSDLVGRRSDPRWGTMRYRRSLLEALGEDEAKKWYAQAAASSRSR